MQLQALCILNDVVLMVGYLFKFRLGVVTQHYAPNGGKSPTIPLLFKRRYKLTLLRLFCQWTISIGKELTVRT